MIALDMWRVYNENMTCRCGKAIHPVRLQMCPHTVTCSSECSKERQQQLRREAARRQTQRKREVVAA